jgi:hypothetical protein
LTMVEGRRTVQREWLEGVCGDEERLTAFYGGFGRGGVGARADNGRHVGTGRGTRFRAKLWTEFRARVISSVRARIGTRSFARFGTGPSAGTRRAEG